MKSVEEEKEEDEEKKKKTRFYVCGQLTWRGHVESAFCRVFLSRFSLFSSVLYTNSPSEH